MFDYSSKSSLEKAERILKEVLICDIPIRVLIGNKYNLVANSKKNSSHTNDNVSQTEVDNIAHMYGCEISLPCDSSLPETVNEIYDKIMEKVKELIGDDMNLENLINKNILIGNKIFSNPNFQKTMKESSYFEPKK